jgi:hypothetical protein
VEELSKKHSERMRFYLSKADEAGQECDRQRVMMQIVQVRILRFSVSAEKFSDKLSALI